MENEEPIAAGEDFARQDDAGHDAEPEMIEVEMDGQVYTLPAALKGALLRQADYTRKTQELAEHRRATEGERLSLSEERRTLRGATADRATLHALDEQLAAFEDVDWDSLGQEDPRRAQALWASYQETGALRDQFAYALSHHDSREELRTAREAAEEMAATGAKLRDEIEGWSPEVATKLVEYGQAFGVTIEELAQMADPRLWKLLHKAWRADEAGREETGAQAMAVRPAVSVAGGGASPGGVRDELGTKEWMRRRNDQMTRGR